MRRPPKPTQQKLQAVLLALLCYLFNALHHGSAAHAVTSSCRNAGAAEKNLAVSSQVDGNLVTICLDKTLQKKILQVSKPKPVAPPKPVVKPKPAPAPTTKPTVRPTTKPLAKPTTKPVAKPIAKPKPPAKVVTKPKITVKHTAVPNSSKAVFQPQPPVVSVSPSNFLKPNQTAIFNALPKVIFGTSKLLGHSVVVRFTPKNESWSFGDGQSAQAPSSPKILQAHTYSQIGKFDVILRTQYAVEYRLASGSWLADPDRIWLPSPVITMWVGITPPKHNAQVVLLTRQ